MIPSPAHGQSREDHYSMLNWGFRPPIAGFNPQLISHGWKRSVLPHPASVTLNGPSVVTSSFG
jgi:hypothetical protein